MKDYQMTCTCGHVMTVKADSLESSRLELKKQMTQEGLDAHWADKHQNDAGPKMTLEEAHAGIDAMTVEVPTPEV